jgi:hypothetical protein
MAQAAGRNRAEFPENREPAALFLAGGPAMIPLGVLSIITVALIIAAFRSAGKWVSCYMQIAGLIRKGSTACQPFQTDNEAVAESSKDDGFTAPASLDCEVRNRSD